MRLRWLYGDQVGWERRMIVTREERGVGWPHDPDSAASIHACRAVVAARLRWPDREEALLRRLHVLAQAGELLDDSDTLELAAEQAGLPVAELAAFCAEPEVEEALRADMRRYTCPSYELLAGDARVDLPGYRPTEAYESALANLEPALTRRADPKSVEAVLAWAPYPLATAEIAAVCDREIADVRVELARGGARFDPVGGDGYWA
jgi:predicted DsbA family dithiol-disulfide isomerase